MTEPDTAPAYEVAPSTAVEPKTLSATGGSLAGTIVSGFLLYLASVLFYHDGTVPLPVSLFVALVVTTGLTFAGGYLARHVNRTDQP